MESVPQNHLPLRCEPEYGAIVCLGCNHGFPEKSIARHVSSHDIFVDVYGPILESFQHETLAKDWSDLSQLGIFRVIRAYHLTYGYRASGPIGIVETIFILSNVEVALSLLYRAFSL